MKVVHRRGDLVFRAFWSTDVMDLIAAFTAVPGKAYARQHDILLRFVNEKLYDGTGVFNREFRERGKSYPDLVLPGTGGEGKGAVIELRFHSSQLKYLRAEINHLSETFVTSDVLLFTYLLLRGFKDRSNLKNPRLHLSRGHRRGATVGVGDAERRAGR